VRHLATIEENYLICLCTMLMNYESKWKHGKGITLEDKQASRLTSSVEGIDGLVLSERGGGPVCWTLGCTLLWRGLAILCCIVFDPRVRKFVGAIQGGRHANAPGAAWVP
jgi:hypothetical protein